MPKIHRRGQIDAVQHAGRLIARGDDETVAREFLQQRGVFPARSAIAVDVDKHRKRTVSRRRRIEPRRGPNPSENFVAAAAADRCVPRREDGKLSSVRDTRFATSALTGRQTAATSCRPERDHVGGSNRNTGNTNDNNPEPATTPISITRITNAVLSGAS